jgi:hypothetical protein
LELIVRQPGHAGKEILDTPYESTGKEDQDFDGAAIMRIYNTTGSVLLCILELADGRVVFLFDDNTWIDSERKHGFIPRLVNRTINSYNGNSRVLINNISAENVI